MFLVYCDKLTLLSLICDTHEMYSKTNSVISNFKVFTQVHWTLIYTVKRLIIGEDLFGEIGKIINFAKISSHQLKKYGPQPLSFNDIAKLNLSQTVIF